MRKNRRGKKTQSRISECSRMRITHGPAKKKKKKIGKGKRNIQTHLGNLLLAIFLKHSPNILMFPFTRTHAHNADQLSMKMARPEDWACYSHWEKRDAREVLA